ncbi:hypothetical protein HY029_05085 [Candidatus Gottesmanbacteria bacterium]|nr:hypothetical protein [Candidatus Gottesmanbacteria bacterium]
MFFQLKLTSTPKPPTATPNPTATPTPVVFSVTSVTASVDPANHSGTCPKQFNFSAQITSNTAGTVTYKWERSDGAGASTQSLSFSGAATQTVTDSWTLGGSGFSYSGWEKVTILTPNSTSSNQANFTLACS